MIDQNKYFKFHNGCVPVKGVKRGLIYDLQRGSFFFLPNSIIDLLKEYETDKLEKIYKDYASQKEVLDQYFTYLLENELIYLAEDLSRFPSNSTKFEPPFILDILFVEIDTMQNHKIELLKNINHIGCSQVVLLTKNVIDIVNLEKILNLFKRSKIQNIKLVTKYSKENITAILNLQHAFLRFKKTVFFESDEAQEPEETQFKLEKGSFDTVLTRRISSIHDLVLNQNAYNESLMYNLFFNRKAYIDDDGNIKNYFTSKTVFGTIEKDDITAIITSESFQKLWKITKENIEVCKSCEFRYVCPDNRIPVLKSNHKNELFTHHTDCNYDPETTEWKS